MTATEKYERARALNTRLKRESKLTSVLKVYLGIIKKADQRRQEGAYLDNKLTEIEKNWNYQIN